MSEETKQTAEELFPQKRMPYSRLKKEFLKADYAIEVNDPLHWVISKTVDGVPIVLDVVLSEKYPFIAPHVTVLSPKPFIVQLKSSWGATQFLNGIFPYVLTLLQDYHPPAPLPIPPPIQTVIDRVKRTNQPVHLVLGSHPGEDPVGRTIYSNPHIFLLDESSESGDTSRFFKIDFTKLDQMNWLCAQLPGAFETIILDTSTMKFFTPHPDRPLEQLAFLDILACIYRILSDTGIFFMAEPGSPYGGLRYMKQESNLTTGEVRWVENTSPHPGQIMIEMVESVGFQVEYAKLEDLDHPLVQLVHKDRSDNQGAQWFLVGTKAKRGGKQQQRQRQRQKQTRRQQKLKKRKTLRRR